MKKNTKDIVFEILSEIFKQSDIDAAVSVNEQNGGYLALVESEEQGILIGYHGHTLESLQQIVSQIVFKKTGEWQQITVSIGDYRERQDEKLKNMATQAAQEVEETGHPVSLSDLSAYERRVIHSSLNEHKQVMTKSEGEGRHRILIIKPR